MKHKINFLKLIITLTSIFFLTNCTTSKITGLWVVQKVEVGQKTMTPKGRWVRFNPDQTQQSGNGWLQHSIGTWTYLKEKQELSIINTNGLADEAAPFKVTLDRKIMYWKRVEEGQNVTVTLNRADNLPMTAADQLFGLWKLEKIINDEKDVTITYSPKNKENLFLRADKMFVENGTSTGRLTGIYRTHPHKDEVEFAYYDKDRVWWQFEVTANTLILKGTKTHENESIIMYYKRTDRF